MRKKVLALSVAAVMAVGMMAGCGSSESASGETAAQESAETSAQSEEAAEAPEEVQEFKVGIVQFMDHASLNQIQEYVEKELDAKSEELGVVFNYKDYEYNGSGDATTLNQIAAQLQDDGVDAVVAIATPTAQIMQSTFEDTDTPIIFSAVTDPVGAKLVESLDAPGANITGTSDALNTDAIMELIFAQNPDAEKIGLLYSKSEDSSTQAIADAKAYLDAKGIPYVEKTGTTTDEVSQAADALLAENVDAVFTPTDNTVMNAELAIYEKFIDAGVPHYTGADSFALNGAFLGFGVNYKDLGVYTADIVAEILANEADPAETPVQTLNDGIATINTETAEAIGVDLDSIKEAFAPYCSEIVETTTAQEFSE